MIIILLYLYYNSISYTERNAVCVHRGDDGGGGMCNVLMGMSIFMVHGNGSGGSGGGRLIRGRGWIKLVVQYTEVYVQAHRVSRARTLWQ